MDHLIPAHGRRPCRRRLPAGLLRAGLLVLCVGSAGARDGPDATLVGGLRIDAGEALEWNPQERYYRATGHVEVTRDGMRLNADELHAYYQEDDRQRQSLDRLVARYNVNFGDNTTRALGERLVYDFGRELVTLKGTPARIQGAWGWLESNGVMTYRTADRVAESTGGIVGRSLLPQWPADLKAREVRIHLAGAADDDSPLLISLLEATGSVIIDSDQGRIEGETAVYDHTSGYVEICGNVRVSRGSSVIEGECVRHDPLTRQIQVSAAPDSRVRARLDAREPGQ